MQNTTTLRHFSPSAIVLALVITLTTTVLFVIGGQSFTRSLTSTRSTNTAEQDLRMVMQEQERERFDQLNASSFVEALRARNAAAQDMRMVMQEQERERLDQLNANPTSPQFGVVRAMDESSVSCLEPHLGCDR